MYRLYFWLVAVAVLAIAGCWHSAGGHHALGIGELPPLPVVLANPMLVPVNNHEPFWDLLVDIVDDYFRIEREDRVRQVGDVLTEGRIDTYYQTGATLLEPHLGDSVGKFNRLESTLQTIRRRALVRVIPAEGGYLVEVNVFKELEDLPQPEFSTSKSLIFRPDIARGRLPREDVPIDLPGSHSKWIPQGRDVALEQRILEVINVRVTEMTLGPVFPAGPFHGFGAG